LNGIAGSMSQRVPVVHIVGVPSTSAEGNHSLLHHTLGDGQYDVFENMSARISVAHTRLRANGHMDICSEIDRVLEQAILKAKPVYISLPTEVVSHKVSAERLGKPIDTSPPETNEPAEAAALEEIVKRINQAEDPIIIVDACSIRHFVLDEVRELVEKSGLTFAQTPMGKTAMDEQHPQYAGVYVGSISEPGVKERVEKADLLIMIGSIMSDFNSGAFTYRTPQDRRIELHSGFRNHIFCLLMLSHDLTTVDGSSLLSDLSIQVISSIFIPVLMQIMNDLGLVSSNNRRIRHIGT
ncbi:hypothetical protein CF326_g7401, partial [Tilletia indica]